MTVTREAIEKAESEVRSADLALTALQAELTSLKAMMEGLDPEDVGGRLDYMDDIAKKNEQIKAAQKRLVETQQTADALKKEFASQQQGAVTTQSSPPPKSAPNAAGAGSPAPTNSPATSQPSSTAAAGTAAQPTPQPTENVAPQSEVETKDGPIDATRYNLAKTWDEEAVINQILSDDYFQPNELNGYDNIAYHWRFFAMPDVEFMYQNETPISDIKELYERIDSYKQVTICETGVTGFNISEVIFDTVSSNHAAVTNITMKVNEPNGVEFLDALKTSTREAGVRNSMDFFYYLELTFKGYDQQGNEQLTPLANLPNGGRWLWTVRVNDIDVSMDSGGGKYVLTMINKDATAFTSEYGLTIDTMRASGDTIGEMFDSLAESLNKTWVDRLQIKNLVNHEFVFHGIPEAKMKRSYVSAEEGRVTQEEASRANAVTRALNGGISADAIRSMPITVQKEDWSSIRAMGDSFLVVDPRNAENIGDQERRQHTKVTANIPRGHRMEQVVNHIFSACETAQCMAKDSFNSLTFSPDDGSDSINDKQFRECVTWKLIPEVKYKLNNKGNVAYDSLSNRYARVITWHVYPHIDQEPILSNTQINQAFQAATKDKFQKDTLAALAVRGFLSKRYDYLFTGLNTEVLNIDLQFNMAWQVLLPRLEAYYSDQQVTHAMDNPQRYTPSSDVFSNVDAADRAFDAARTAYNREADDWNRTPAEDRDEEQRQSLADRKEEAERLRDERTAAQQAVREARKESRANAKEWFGSIDAPEQNYARTYAERVLDEQRKAELPPARNIDLPLIPFSYGAGNEAKQEAGYGMTGQWHAGRSLYGAVLNQSSDPSVPKFTTLDMTIRGDPFWIGEGSYEAAMAHHNDLRHGNYHNDRLGPNHALMRFKYPVDVDDSGNITLKDNETVTGIYKITEVKNKFSGGMFTQELKGVRMPLIDLYSSLYGFRTGEGSTIDGGPESAEQRRERVANQIAKERDAEEAKRKTAEEATKAADERRARAQIEDLQNNPLRGPKL